MATKTIVVSAVNLNVGGTLTILRDCLAYLSQLVEDGGFRVIAIVYSKDLAFFPNIEYIETQWPKKRWLNRLWYEYVSLKKVSKKIGPVYLWFSLHDTTPNVIAEHRAVYCHNPFPFYRWKWREFVFAPKIVLFSIFSKFIYQKNIHKNDYVVVQQKWIKERFIKLFSINPSRLVVALPDKPKAASAVSMESDPDKYRFIFPASPNSHKNFECLAEATAILAKQGISNFEVLITLTGYENKYASWLKQKWGHVKNLSFIGFQTREALFDWYAKSDCLVFPSKVETWGLPITEFAMFEKPMLLADLPYSNETAAGNEYVDFFDPDSPWDLKDKMIRLIEQDYSFLKKVSNISFEQPVTNDWEELFTCLLSGKKCSVNS